MTADVETTKKPSSFRRFITTLLVSLTVVLMLAAVGLGSFIWWLRYHPVSLPLLTHLAEEAVKELNLGFAIQVDETILSWDTDKEILAITIRDSSIYDDQHRTVATIPKIRMTMALLPLLRGSFHPSKLVLHRPYIRVYHGTPPSEEEKNVYYANAMILYENVFKTLSRVTRGGYFFPVEQVVVQQAEILLKNTLQEKEYLWHLNEAHSTIEVEQDQFIISTDLDADFAGEEAVFRHRLAIPDRGNIESILQFRHLPLHIVMAFLPKQIPFLEKHKKLYAVLSGAVAVTINEAGHIQTTECEVSNAYGVAHFPDFLPHMVPFQKGKGRILFDFKRDLYTIKDFQFIAHEKALIALSGNVKQQKGVDIPDLDLQVEASHVDVATMKKLWSPLFFPDVRDWIARHVTDGLVSQAKGRLRLKGEDLARAMLPKDAIHFTLAFDNAGFHYHSMFPPIHGIKGTGRITEEGVTLDVEKGIMDAIDLHNIQVVLPYTQGARMSITGRATGDLVAALSLLPQVPLPTETLKGTMESQIDLKLPYTMTEDFLNDPNVSYRIDAMAQDVSYVPLPAAFSLQGGTFHSRIRNDRITIYGSSHINGVPVSMSWDNKTAPEAILEAKGAHRITVESTITAQDIERLGLFYYLPLQDGNVHVQGVLEASDHFALKAKADLSQAAIHWNAIGVQKPKGEDLSIVLQAETNTQNTHLHVKQFDIKSAEIGGQASLIMPLDFSAVEQLQVKNLHLADNLLHVSYEHPPGKGGRLSVSGEVLDLRQSDMFKLLDMASSEGQMDAFSLTLPVIYMKNNERFQQVDIALSCVGGVCQQGHMKFAIKGKALVDGTLTSKDGKRTVKGHAHNVGAILNALDVAPYMEGGNLSVEAEGSLAADSSLKGKANLKDFTAIDTPVLAKIVSLSSLPGIASMLQGEGIPFKKMHIPFTFADKRITFEEVVASGGVLGVTGNGFVNLENHTLFMKGTLVPAVYGVNQVLSNIPVVGDALLGGKGGGIIAANYTVKGPYANLKMSVNPLSILTPGFLRKIFSVVE